MRQPHFLGARHTAPLQDKLQFCPFHTQSRSPGVAHPFQAAQSCEAVTWGYVNFELTSHLCDTSRNRIQRSGIISEHRAGHGKALTELLLPTHRTDKLQRKPKYKRKIPEEMQVIS